MQAFGPFVPTMIGGAADLDPLDVHRVRGRRATSRPEHSGRNVAWGVREHGMGAAVNGLALHGGIVKPFCSTFFVFTDYMRPPIRLSALMGLDVVWIFSHDSVAVGEDGPTHQPVEHLAAMRAIPKLTVIRPSDANEASRPGALMLETPRPVLPRPLAARTSRRSTAAALAPASGLRRGAYVLADADSPDVVLVATGAEVAHRARGPRPARREGRRRRGSSRCRAGSSSRPQDADYRDEVLPAGRAEDLGRGGDDVRLVALGRRVDRDRHLRRLGQGRQGARALRDQPRGGRRQRAGARRRARQGRSEGQRRLHPGRAGRGAGRHRDRRPAGDLDDLPGPRRGLGAASICVGEVEDARALAGPGVALAGERHNVRIEGFDFGNSPREFAGAARGERSSC